MESSSMMSMRDEAPVAIPIGQMSVLEDLVRQMEEIIRSARNMPLSSSALVDRQEVLDVIDMLKRSIPEEIARARAVIRDRDEVLERAQAQGQRIVERAKAERERLLSDTEIVRAATRHAEDVIAQAETRARKMTAQAEKFVDGKLATFEVLLQRTVQVVERGRAKLAGAAEADQLADEQSDDQERGFPS